MCGLIKALYSLFHTIKRIKKIKNYRVHVCTIEGLIKAYKYIYSISH